MFKLDNAIKVFVCVIFVAYICGVLLLPPLVFHAYTMILLAIIAVPTILFFTIPMFFKKDIN